MIVPQFSAQLAGLDGQITGDSNFVVEEKLDGIRALMVFDELGLEQRNRHGENKSRLNAQTKLRHELMNMGVIIPDLYKGTVIDGEAYSKESWNMSMHLSAQSGSNDGAGELYFVAFDLPFLCGLDLRDLPWSERRKMLESLMEMFIAPNSLLLLSEILPAKQSEVDRIWSAGGEGVIIKDTRAPYASGDRNAWKKVKKVQTADAFIMDFTPGRGKYKGKVGAIVLGQYRGYPAEKVRVTQISGMDDATRFGLGLGDLGRVIEFEFQDKTAGSYRHPRFLRWRNDKTSFDCVWENS